MKIVAILVTALVGTTGGKMVNIFQSSDQLVEQQDSIPTATPTEVDLLDLCPNGNFLELLECRDNLLPDGFSFDDVSCEDFLPFSIAVETCLPIHCGVECEEVEDVVAFFIAQQNQEAGCNFPEQCLSTLIPTAAPTVNLLNLCPNGNFLELLECRDNLLPDGFSFDDVSCEDFLPFSIAVETCLPIHCGVECEEVEDVVAFFIAQQNEEAGCNFPEQCLSSVIPTAAPTEIDLLELCPTGNFAQFFECRDNLLPEDFDFNDVSCEDFLPFATAVETCLPIHCGVECEEVEGIVAFFIAQQNEEAGCNFPEQCLSSVIPTAAPTVNLFNLCPTGNFADFFECRDNLLPYDFDFNDVACEDFPPFRIAVETCLPIHCGVECEEVEDLVAFFIAQQNELVGCDFPEECLPTSSPTEAPTSSPLTEIVVILVVVLATLALLLAVLLVVVCANGRKNRTEITQDARKEVVAAKMAY